MVSRFCFIVVHHVIIASAVRSERLCNISKGAYKWVWFSSSGSLPIFSQSVRLIDSHILVLFRLLLRIKMKRSPSFTLTNHMRATWIKTRGCRARDRDGAPWVNFNHCFSGWALCIGFYHSFLCLRLMHVVPFSIIVYFDFIANTKTFTTQSHYNARTSHWQWIKVNMVINLLLITQSSLFEDQNVLPSIKGDGSLRI